MSIQAYQRAATRAESPRDIEYRALGVVTAALVRAREEGRANLGALARAIHDNRRLWSVFSSDCADPNNALPQPVRARIISIAIFVDRHSSAVLREGADLEPLIDINRALMEGLAGR
jgi:flagellar biosynthesis activator protein FlaF